MQRAFYIVFFLSAPLAWGQTQVDLRTQSKSVDFSGAAATKPARTGTSLPTTCSTGEVFFNTTAPAGANMYGCTAPNTWAAETGLISVPNYGKSFIATTLVTILGTEHLMNTSNLVVTCYDQGTPARRIEPDAVTVDPVLYNVTVTFAQPQAGRCVVNGNAVNGVAAGGAVANVFGRTGGVTAQAGDYSFPLITGTTTDAQTGAGINATKIGTGTVNNGTFGYIANLQSDAQAQLNGKSPVGHSHNTGGDVNGDLSITTVTRLQGHNVGAATPSDQQALIWSQAAGAWQPQTLPVSGAQFASQLLDFKGSLDQTQIILTIGAQCSVQTPCVLRFGTTTWSVVRPAVATLGSGSVGQAFVYAMPDGSIVVGHNMSVTCSGCTSVSGVTAFPSNVIPLCTWTAANGQWNAAGGTDLRTFLSSRNVTTGSGLTALDSGALLTMSVDTSVVPTYIAGTGTLNFGAISSGTCAAEMTFSMPGASAGDPVAPGWPPGLPAGVIGMMRISASSTAGVQLCNWSGSAVSVNTTFRATVVRSF
jgi:hypothetical protein